YEISKSRAAYGVKNLGVEILTDEKYIRPGNDIFFSSHVIEHHPDISGMIRLAEKTLAPGGYFIAISPNGSLPFREKDPSAFHQAWGKVHTNYLNGDFYKHLFQNYPYYVGTNPFNMKNIHPLKQDECIVDELSGEELLVI